MNWAEEYGWTGGTKRYAQQTYSPQALSNLIVALVTQEYPWVLTMCEPDLIVLEYTLLEGVVRWSFMPVP